MLNKRFEELELKDDFMFCTVMQNEELCKETLSAILSEDINNIAYTDDQKSFSINANSKSIRLDVYVETDKARFDLEMQNDNQVYLPYRSRYYSSMIDLNSLKKGEDYYNLPTNYVIFICTFPIFDGKKHKYTFVNLCSEDKNIALKDGTFKIFLSTKGKEDDISNKLKELLTYLDSGEKHGNFSRKLDNEVCKIRNNERWRLDYMAFSVKFEDEMRKIEKRAREEALKTGLKEGLEQGLEQGHINTLKSIIRMNLDNNMSLEDIAAFLGEDIEKIKSLSENLD